MNRISEQSRLELTKATGEWAEINDCPIKLMQLINKTHGVAFEDGSKSARMHAARLLYQNVYQKPGETILAFKERFLHALEYHNSLHWKGSHIKL